jgi:GNAT superfamily N-acetyltransferase
MPVSIYLASPDDADLLLRAHEDVFDAPPDPALTRSYLAAPHLHIALAVADDQVIGMCSGVVYHHPDKPPQWWINELGVATPWRRRKIASRLVEACGAEAARLGCTEIWVVADPTPMAEGFWQGLGWERIGARLAMFTHPLAA